MKKKVSQSKANCPLSQINKFEKVPREKHVGTPALLWTDKITDTTENITTCKKLIGQIIPFRSPSLRKLCFVTKKCVWSSFSHICLILLPVIYTCESVSTEALVTKETVVTVTVVLTLVAQALIYLTLQNIILTIELNN